MGMDRDGPETCLARGCDREETHEAAVDARRSPARGEADSQCTAVHAVLGVNSQRDGSFGGGVSDAAGCLCGAGCPSINSF